MNNAQFFIVQMKNIQCNELFVTFIRENSKFIDSQ